MRQITSAALILALLVQGPAATAVSSNSQSRGAPGDEGKSHGRTLQIANLIEREERKLPQALHCDECPSQPRLVPSSNRFASARDYIISCVASVMQFWCYHKTMGGNQENSISWMNIFSNSPTYRCKHSISITTNRFRQIVAPETIHGRLGGII